MLAFLLLAALGAGFLGHSWWWPWRRCPRCMGRSGRGAGSTPKAYNRCSRCGGSGELLRPAAWVLSRITGRAPRGSK